MPVMAAVFGGRFPDKNALLISFEFLLVCIFPMFLV